MNCETCNSHLKSPASLKRGKGIVCHTNDLEAENAKLRLQVEILSRMLRDKTRRAPKDRKQRRAA